MGKYVPLLSHLFLFMQNAKESPHLLHSIIREYEQASGQNIIANKSSIYFSKLVRGRRRLVVANYLGMKISNGEGKYLGLSYLIARSKKEIFRILKGAYMEEYSRME